MSAAEVLGLQSVELLTSSGGTKRGSEALAGRTVALYFSAHWQALWCPPCRAFTPVLAAVYGKLQPQHDFEVIFVSGDRDAAQAEEYFKHMPWLAIPFEQHEVRQRLSKQFNVMGIPRLVIVGPDGQVLASDARSAVVSDPAGANYPWRGSSAPAQGLIGLLLSPKGLLMLLLLLYWFSQWISKKE